jgi:hypothetical protein
MGPISIGMVEANIGPSKGVKATYSERSGLPIKIIKRYKDRRDQNCGWEEQEENRAHIAAEEVSIEMCGIAINGLTTGTNKLLPGTWTSLGVLGRTKIISWKSARVFLVLLDVGKASSDDKEQNDLRGENNQ